MKIRVLYPLGVDGYTKKPTKAGETVDLPTAAAEALIASGAAEKPDAKPADPEPPEWLKTAMAAGVEQATAAPGEKRQTRKPRAKKT